MKRCDLVLVTGIRESGCAGIGDPLIGLLPLIFIEIPTFSS